MDVCARKGGLSATIAFPSGWRCSKPGTIRRQVYRLDREIRAAVRRFDAASDAAQLMTLWNAHLQDGDIPGPYWATLTHPAATPDITSAAFGRVHMLSHLVGAANRADIRRLVVLELERDRLADELSKTKHRLAEQNRELGGAAEQQTKTIRDLTGQLEAARAVAARLRQDQAERGLGALRAQVDRASAALAASRRDVERERQRLAAQLREAQELREQCERQEQEVRALRTECGALEQLLEGTIELSNPCRAGSAVCPAFNLCGRRIVYVGGRSHLIPHFRSLVERAGGTLIHHDGGVEDATGRRNGILTQGDAVLCAMDCVSHDACWRVKHLCKQRTKAFICGVR